MSRIRIDIPEKFIFSTDIEIRITDLNYGGHVGNDTILSLVHEARVRFLKQFGCTELNFGGIGLIMSDAGIEFKSESFYGDNIRVSVAVQGFSRVGFDLYYQLSRQPSNKIIALAKTGMICYDYSLKKVVSVPEEAKSRLVGS
ncbi:MAG: acyl-CoA thioesterase [Flavisolibacter sp.]